MTTSLIYREDVDRLRHYMLFLHELPQYIEAFKIIFDLVPPKEYGQYKEPLLDHVVLRARTDSTFWSNNLQPLRQLYHEVNQFTKELTEFSNRVSTYIASLDSPERRASIKQVDHARALIALSGKLKPEPANNALDILRRCKSDMNAYVRAFNEKGDTSSILHTSAYTIVPRIMDFMDITIHRCSGSTIAVGFGVIPGSLVISAWLTGPLFANTEQLRKARNRLSLTKHYYAGYTSAASNMNTYCYRISHLLQNAHDKLADVDEQSSLAKLSLSLRLMSVPLKEARALSGEMTTVLQTYT